LRSAITSLLLVEERERPFPPPLRPREPLLLRLFDELLRDELALLCDVLFFLVAIYDVSICPCIHVRH